MKLDLLTTLKLDLPVEPVERIIRQRISNDEQTTRFEEAEDLRIHCARIAVGQLRAEAKTSIRAVSDRQGLHIRGGGQGAGARAPMSDSESGG